MKDHICFEISFPSIDFDSFMSNSEKSTLSHHAHIFSRKDEIEIRIYFESKTYFGRKLSLWASHINWRDFGSYIKTSNENQNSRLTKIDLSESILLGITNGTDQFEGNLQFVSIKVDFTKYYWIPAENDLNSAEFYFDNEGFKIVSEFYPPLLGFDGDFRIQRYDKMNEYYQIDKAEFRPEFDFSVSDNKNSRETIIIKEPLVKFRYQDGIGEDQVFKYSEIIRLVSSFYLHSKTSFTHSRIRLREHTITTRKIQKENTTYLYGGLTSFKIYWNFHEFMQADWKHFALKNYKKLSKVVELFNQSLQVDNNSKFLIRFNIIEICMGGIKVSDEKFQPILSDIDETNIYDKVTSLLLKTIKKEEHNDFLAKWKGVKNKLKYKPMKSPLLSYFENQNLNPSKFPISVNKIKSLRDKLTHGSIDKIDENQLEKANILLYRITGILILNLLGINDWTLDTKTD